MNRFLLLVVLGACAPAYTLRPPVEIPLPQHVWTTTQPPFAYKELAVVSVEQWSFSGALDQLVQLARARGASDVINVTWELRTVTVSRLQCAKLSDCSHSTQEAPVWDFRGLAVRGPEQ